ncbi:MAG: hypothetical protein U0V18_15780 [Anaerolineales bacterium]
MDSQIVAIYCICEDILKGLSLRYSDDKWRGYQASKRQVLLWLEIAFDGDQTGTTCRILSNARILERHRIPNAMVLILPSLFLHLLLETLNLHM